MDGKLKKKVIKTCPLMVRICTGGCLIVVHNAGSDGGCG